MKEKGLTKEGPDVRMLPIKRLHPARNNRRTIGASPEKLEDLAASIRAVGRVLQPIVVRPDGEDWEIVVGARRFMAAKIVGLKDLPCSVMQMSDDEARAASIVENVQREDLHPLDEAVAIMELMQLMDAEETAREIGCSVSHVQRRVRLLDLEPEARETFAAGGMNIGHALALCGLQPEDQIACLKQMKDHTRWGGEYSAKELRDMIAQSVLTRLGDAPFKRDDAGLVPEAGTCAECLKRSGAQPALFPDVGKDDLCTDPACYNGKLDALVEAQQRKLEGEEYKMVSEGWHTGKTPEGVLDVYQWTECKKKDEGAVRCLVTEGARRGRLTWGIIRGARSGTATTKEEKEKAKKTRKLVSREKGFRKELIDAAAEKARAGLTHGVERILALQFFDRLWDNYRKDLCGLYGWERPPKKEGEYYREGWTETGLRQIRGLPEEELKPFIVRCLLVAALEVEESEVSFGRRAAETERWKVLEKMAGEFDVRIPKREKEE